MGGGIISAFSRISTMRQNFSQCVYHQTIVANKITIFPNIQELDQKMNLCGVLEYCNIEEPTLENILKIVHKYLSVLLTNNTKLPLSKGNSEAALYSENHLSIARLKKMKLNYHWQHHHEFHSGGKN